MRLTEIDKRQLVHSARGGGELRSHSNFDKPHKRVQKLIDAGLLVSAFEATELGREKAREIIEKEWPGDDLAHHREKLFEEIK
ncbi:hypothetical protein [Dinoroseobacter sp. S375]|uniref:hypothetical protein n=1 Tax=Dinoroseobacter sp. S375 TaxID=3415136 RepID=UPI003C7C60A2